MDTNPPDGDDSRPQRRTFEATPDNTLAASSADARSLRGLAHPLRMRLLGLLREFGPSTSTRLATRLGLNTGATSYHLRQLAAYGFVEEDTGRGNRRERWWRAAQPSTYFEPSYETAEAAELSHAYLRTVATGYAERMVRAVDEEETLPRQWQHAGTMSDFMFRLTPGELESMLDDILEVFRRYRDYDPEHSSAEAPDEARPISLILHAAPIINTDTDTDADTNADTNADTESEQEPEQ
ncbi:MAG: helix-turn-helix domain-containing protein [Nocardioidaceae bacterium]